VGSAKRPEASSKQVSAQMKRMPRENSGPELRLRRILHSRGLRYRTNLRGLPGTPDLVFSAAKIAVFVDGCFWHQCPEHGTMPKAADYSEQIQAMIGYSIHPAFMGYVDGMHPLRCLDAGYDSASTGENEQSRCFWQAYSGRAGRALRDQK
jgi:DNA mismatch endonuclease Vsr